MNAMEELKARLEKEGRTVVCGVPEGNALAVGLMPAESKAAHAFGGAAVFAPAVAVSVYGADCAEAARLADEVALDADAAEGFRLSQDGGAAYDRETQRYVFKKIYKKLKI